MQTVVSVGYFPDASLKTLDLLEHVLHLMEQGVAVLCELDIASHMAEEVLVGILRTLMMPCKVSKN